MFRGTGGRNRQTSDCAGKRTAGVGRKVVISKYWKAESDRGIPVPGGNDYRREVYESDRRIKDGRKAEKNEEACYVNDHRFDYSLADMRCIFCFIGNLPFR